MIIHITKLLIFIIYILNIDIDLSTREITNTVIINEKAEDMFDFKNQIFENFTQRFTYKHFIFELDDSSSHKYLQYSQIDNISEVFFNQQSDQFNTLQQQDVKIKQFLTRDLSGTKPFKIRDKCDYVNDISDDTISDENVDQTKQIIINMRIQYNTNLGQLFSNTIENSGSMCIYSYIYLPAFISYYHSDLLQMKTYKIIQFQTSGRINYKYTIQDRDLDVCMRNLDDYCQTCAEKRKTFNPCCQEQPNVTEFNHKQQDCNTICFSRKAELETNKNIKQTSNQFGVNTKNNEILFMFHSINGLYSANLHSAMFSGIYRNHKDYQCFDNSGNLSDSTTCFDDEYCNNSDLNIVQYKDSRMFNEDSLYTLHKQGEGNCTKLLTTRSAARYTILTEAEEFQTHDFSSNKAAAEASCLLNANDESSKTYCKLQRVDNKIDHQIIKDDTKEEKWQNCRFDLMWKQDLRQQGTVAHSDQELIQTTDNSLLPHQDGNHYTLASQFCFSDLNPSTITTTQSFPIGSDKYDTKIVMTMLVTATADPLMINIKNDKFFIVVDRVVQEKDWNWTLMDCINVNEYRQQEKSIRDAGGQGKTQDTATGKDYPLNFNFNPQDVFDNSQSTTRCEDLSYGNQPSSNNNYIEFTRRINDVNSVSWSLKEEIQNGQILNSFEQIQRISNYQKQDQIYSYKTNTQSFSKDNTIRINDEEQLEASEGTIFFKSSVPLSRNNVPTDGANEASTVMIEMRLDIFNFNQTKQDQTENDDIDQDEGHFFYRIQKSDCDQAAPTFDHDECRIPQDLECVPNVNCRFKFIKNNQYTNFLQFDVDDLRQIIIGNRFEYDGQLIQFQDNEHTRMQGDITPNSTNNNDIKGTYQLQFNYVNDSQMENQMQIRYQFKLPDTEVLKPVKIHNFLCVFDSPCNIHQNKYANSQLDLNTNKLFRTYIVYKNDNFDIDTSISIFEKISFKILKTYNQSEHSLIYVDYKTEELYDKKFIKLLNISTSNDSFDRNNLNLQLDSHRNTMPDNQNCQIQVNQYLNIDQCRFQDSPKKFSISKMSNQEGIYKFNQEVRKRCCTVNQNIDPNSGIDIEGTKIEGSERQINVDQFIVKDDAILTVQQIIPNVSSLDNFHYKHLVQEKTNFFENQNEMSIKINKNSILAVFCIEQTSQGLDVESPTDYQFMQNANYSSRTQDNLQTTRVNEAFQSLPSFQIKVESILENQLLTELLMTSDNVSQDVFSELNANVIKNRDINFQLLAQAFQINNDGDRWEFMPFYYNVEYDLGEFLDTGIKNNIINVTIDKKSFYKHQSVNAERIQDKVYFFLNICHGKTTECMIEVNSKLVNQQQVDLSGTSSDSNDMKSFVKLEYGTTKTFLNIDQFSRQPDSIINAQPDSSSSQLSLEMSYDNFTIYSASNMISHFKNQGYNRKYKITSADTNIYSTHSKYDQRCPTCSRMSVHYNPKFWNQQASTNAPRVSVSCNNVLTDYQADFTINPTQLQSDYKNYDPGLQDIQAFNMYALRNEEIYQSFEYINHDQIMNTGNKYAWTTSIGLDIKANTLISMLNVSAQNIDVINQIADYNVLVNQLVKINQSQIDQIQRIQKYKFESNPIILIKLKHTHQSDVGRQVSLKMSDYQLEYKYDQFNFQGNQFDDLDVIFRNFVWEILFKAKDVQFGEPDGNFTDTEEQNKLISDENIDYLQSMIYFKFNYQQSFNNPQKELMTIGSFPNDDMAADNINCTPHNRCDDSAASGHHFGYEHYYNYILDYKSFWNRFNADINVDLKFSSARFYNNLHNISYFNYIKAVKNKSDIVLNENDQILNLKMNVKLRFDTCMKCLDKLVYKSQHSKLKEAFNFKVYNNHNQKQSYWFKKQVIDKFGDFLNNNDTKFMCYDLISQYSIKFHPKGENETIDNKLSVFPSENIENYLSGKVWTYLQTFKQLSDKNITNLYNNLEKMHPVQLKKQRVDVENRVYRLFKQINQEFKCKYQEILNVKNYFFHQNSTNVYTTQNDSSSSNNSLQKDKLQKINDIPGYDECKNKNEGFIPMEVDIINQKQAKSMKNLQIDSIMGSNTILDFKLNDIALDIVSCGSKCFGSKWDTNKTFKEQAEDTMLRNVFRQDKANQNETDVFKFIIDQVNLTDQQGIDYEFEILNNQNEDEINISKHLFVNGQTPFHKINKVLKIKNLIAPQDEYTINQSESQIFFMENQDQKIIQEANESQLFENTSINSQKTNYFKTGTVSIYPYYNQYNSYESLTNKHFRYSMDLRYSIFYPMKCLNPNRPAHSQDSADHLQNYGAPVISKASLEDSSQGEQDFIDTSDTCVLKFKSYKVKKSIPFNQLLQDCSNNYLHNNLKIYSRYGAFIQLLPEQIMLKFESNKKLHQKFKSLDFYFKVQQKKSQTEESLDFTNTDNTFNFKESTNTTNLKSEDVVLTDVVEIDQDSGEKRYKDVIYFEDRMQRKNTQKVFKFDDANLEQSLLVNTGILEDYSNTDIQQNKAQMVDKSIKFTIQNSDNQSSQMSLCPRWKRFQYSINTLKKAYPQNDTLIDQCSIDQMLWMCPDIIDETADPCDEVCPGDQTKCSDCKKAILPKGYRWQSQSNCVKSLTDKKEQCQDTFSNRFVNYHFNDGWIEENKGFDSLDLYNHQCGMELTFSKDFNLEMKYKEKKDAIQLMDHLSTSETDQLKQDLDLQLKKPPTIPFHKIYNEIDKTKNKYKGRIEILQQTSQFKNSLFKIQNGSDVLEVGLLDVVITNKYSYHPIKLELLNRGSYTYDPAKEVKADFNACKNTCRGKYKIKYQEMTYQLRSQNGIVKSKDFRSFSNLTCNSRLYDQAVEQERKIQEEVDYSLLHFGFYILEPEQAIVDTNDNDRIKFFPDDNCLNEESVEGDKAVSQRFEQGLDLELLLKAPAMLMNLTVEKFGMDGTVIETMSFKNSQANKQLQLIKGLRVSLAFNLSRGDITQYKSNKIRFDGKFALEVSPKQTLQSTKQNLQLISNPQGQCKHMFTTMLNQYKFIHQQQLTQMEQNQKNLCEDLNTQTSGDILNQQNEPIEVYLKDTEKHTYLQDSKTPIEYTKGGQTLTLDLDFSFTQSFTSANNFTDGSLNQGNNLNFMLHSMVLYLGDLESDKVHFIDKTTIENEQMKQARSRIFDDEPFCDIKELNPIQSLCSSSKEQDQDCIQYFNLNSELQQNKLSQ